MTAWMASVLQTLLDFSRVLNASIAASWMVLAVIVLRLLLKRAPKWSHVALWGLVAVRLLLPFSIESGFSLIPSAETVPRELLRYQGAQLHDPAYLDIVSNPNVWGEVSVSAGKTVDSLQWDMVEMTPVWLAGVGALILYITISVWLLRRRVATAVFLEENIFQSEYVNSPFVLGVLKPKIYLPFAMDARDMEYVIAHEQAHICRGDHWWKPLGFLLLTIHWFNPLLWYAYTLFCRDMELACDEKVIRDMDREQRADYTQALVSCSVNRRMPALAFGEVGVKERVKSVLNYRKPTWLALALALLACVLTAVCFLTNPKQDCYSLRVVVPPGGHEQFVYTEEEVSPLDKYVTVYCGEGMGDASVILLPTEVRTETAYDQEWYITPGLSVKLEAEKGGWFKVGVRMWNETGEDKVVYVMVEDVEVRIADRTDEILHLGLNAEIVDIDAAKRILYVKDMDDAAAVFGERCAIDCSEAVEKYNLLYVNYGGEGDVRTIDFEEFQVGDAVIIGLRDGEKQTALNGTAAAEQVQLATQRMN